MKNLKMYDEKNYDYYNPKPYLQNLVDICLKDKKSQNSVSYDIDSNRYDYLFVYENKESEEHENKKYRVFHNDFVNLIKTEDIERVRQALQLAVYNYGFRIRDLMNEYKNTITQKEQIILDAQITLDLEKIKLKELENEISKYKDPSGTPEVPF
jgi:hypothetical protein